MNDKSTLAAIRTRLHTFSETELEAFATAGTLASTVATALGVESVSNSPQKPEDATPLDPDSFGQEVQRWARIELALGLELHVRDDASPATRELVERIRRTSATSPTANTFTAPTR
jgi:hypothetical protein